MAKTTQVQVQKPAAKSAKKAPAKTAPQIVAPVVTHYIKDGFRPGSGRALFAYTMAWLQVSGLIDGGSIPRATALKLAGSTAIKYHSEKTGRMVDDGTTVKLSPTGANFFADRPHDAKDREAYAAMLTTGQPDGRLIKTPHAIGTL